MSGAKVEFGHRRFVLARGRAVVRVRTAAVAATLVTVAVLLGGAALALGDYPVTIAQMIGSFTGATDGLERWSGACPEPRRRSHSAPPWARRERCSRRSPAIRWPVPT